jgi:hypothetical protein
LRVSTPVGDKIGSGDVPEECPTSEEICSKPCPKSCPTVRPKECPKLCPKVRPKLFPTILVAPCPVPLHCIDSIAVPAHRHAIATRGSSPPARLCSSIVPLGCTVEPCRGTALTAPPYRHRAGRGTALPIVVPHR